MGTEKVNKQIGEFLDLVRKDFPISKVVFFGSAFNGEISEDSDIDLVVISNWFEDKSVDDRYKALSSYVGGNEYFFDIFPVTEKEFDSASRFSTVGIAKRSGMELKLNN